MHKQICSVSFCILDLLKKTEISIESMDEDTKDS